MKQEQLTERQKQWGWHLYAGNTHGFPKASIPPYPWKVAEWKSTRSELLAQVLNMVPKAETYPDKEIGRKVQDLLNYIIDNPVNIYAK